MEKVSSLNRLDVNILTYESSSALAQVLVASVANSPVGPFSEEPCKTHRGRR